MSKKWPPPRPPERKVKPRPWDPQNPRDPKLKDDSKKLLYIVVDEVVGDNLGLSLAPWPDADSQGRLRFDMPRGSLEIASTREDVEGFVFGAKRRGRRAMTLGTVFAARVKKGTSAAFFRKWLDAAEEDLSQLKDLHKWFERPCDITEEAREVAKLAYYSAVMSTVPRKLGEKWKLDTGG